MKITGKNKNKIVIIKNNITIRIAGKVSRYIDASMNRATPTSSKCGLDKNGALLEIQIKWSCAHFLLKPVLGL